MRHKEVWYSFSIDGWRVKDGELFTYLDADSVVGHFVNRDRPARVQIVGLRADAPMHDMLRSALDAAHVPYEDCTEVNI